MNIPKSAILDDNGKLWMLPNVYKELRELVGEALKKHRKCSAYKRIDGFGSFWYIELPFALFCMKEEGYKNKQLKEFVSSLYESDLQTRMNLSSLVTELRQCT